MKAPVWENVIANIEAYLETSMMMETKAEPLGARLSCQQQTHAIQAH